MGILARCNMYQFEEDVKFGLLDNANLIENLSHLADCCEENASACGLFEMVAEKVQELSK